MNYPSALPNLQFGRAFFIQIGTKIYTTLFAISMIKMVILNVFKNNLSKKLIKKITN